MITALSDVENKIKAFEEQCDGYIVKPVNQENIENELNKLSLI